MPTCLSCLNRQHGAATKNEAGEFGMSQKREEMTNLPEAFLLESTLAERCAIRKDLASDNGASRMSGQTQPRN